MSSAYVVTWMSRDTIAVAIGYGFGFTSCNSTVRGYWLRVRVHLILQHNCSYRLWVRVHLIQ